jgi:predicted nucleotidyltransferase
MYKFKVKRVKEQNNLFLEAEEYIKRLREVLGPISAAIYGSVVRGDFNIGSDIDIVVISDALAKDPLERMEVLFRYTQGREEPKGYRLNEFKKMIKQRHPTALGIINEGKILIDDLKVFAPY